MIARRFLWGVSWAVLLVSVAGCATDRSRTDLGVPTNFFGVRPDAPPTLTFEGSPLTNAEILGPYTYRQYTLTEGTYQPSQAPALGLFKGVGESDLTDSKGAYAPLESAARAHLSGLTRALRTKGGTKNPLDLTSPNSLLSFSQPPPTEAALQSFITRFEAAFDRDTQARAQAQLKEANAHLTQQLGYYQSYFANRYQDRNGTQSVVFDRKSAQALALQLASAPPSDTSPEIAGQLFEVLTDFLGDSMFGVPYYNEALFEDLDARARLEQLVGVNVLQPGFDAFLTDPNTTDTLIERRIQILGSGHVLVPGVPDSAYFDDEGLPTIPDYTRGTAPEGALMARWSALGQYEQAPLVKEARQNALRDEYVQAFDELVQAYTRLLRVKQGSAVSQRAFTCVSSGTIETHFGPWGLQIWFNGVSESAPGQQATDDPCSTAYHAQNPKDYSRLVARLVALASQQADKLTRSTVGGLIRGGNALALDNEVVAEIVSAVAGTAARKISEVVVFRTLLRIITDPSVELSVVLGRRTLCKRAFLNHLEAGLPAAGTTRP